MGAVITFDPRMKAKLIEQIRNNGMKVVEAAETYQVNSRTIYG